MKPEKYILNTDFYQLSNDGSVEISFDVPKGTEGKLSNLFTFKEVKFKVGGAQSDFLVTIWDNLTNDWTSENCKLARASDGGTYYITVFRTENNTFKATLTLTGLGGIYPPGYDFSLFTDRDISVKIKVKTFKFPAI